jgi:hypothetical protein
MSDCVKCWDTPCTCGYDYCEWGFDRRLQLVAAILGIPIDAARYLLGHLENHVHPMAAEREADRKKQAETAKAWLDDLIARKQP